MLWDDLLSENDRKCLANRPSIRQRRELGVNPVLVVIDMQSGVIGEDRPAYEQNDRLPMACGSAAWTAIRHLQEMIPAARQAGIPVFYSRHVYRPESGLTVAPDSSFRAEDPGSELTGELPREPGDLYIEKNRPSIFFQTPTVYMLMSRGIDTLLVTGNTTSGCIRASAIDGIGYGFKVAVIGDCVFDRIELSHKASLFDLSYKYCDVIGLNDAYQYIIATRQGRS